MRTLEGIGVSDQPPKAPNKTSSLWKEGGIGHCAEHYNLTLQMLDPVLSAPQSQVQDLITFTLTCTKVTTCSLLTTHFSFLSVVSLRIIKLFQLEKTFEVVESKH